LKFDDILEQSRYDRITTDIQDHASNFPLVSRGKKGKTYKGSDADPEAYISELDELASFVHDNLIIYKMAYQEFAYDIEKAWCNNDVRKIIQEARAKDKSTTAKDDPMYADFEKLANEYLTKEGQSCKDLDNQ
jgi:hypothetical protein